VSGRSKHPNGASDRERLEDQIRIGSHLEADLPSCDIRIQGFEDDRAVEISDLVVGKRDNIELVHFES
jgi:hypothetical protein